jgi:two-component sensor histidine kinase
LKEVHHRVKNNLQMIVSLLSLQSSYLDDPVSVGVLDETRGRIRSISAIHDMLYDSADLSRINFSEYLGKMVGNLSHFHNFKPGKVEVQVRAEEVYLDVNRAIPCGLIINELLTNAVKHAFPSDRSGRIEISFRSDAQDGCVLEVADNGIGLPEDLDPNEVTSMGLQLVRLLVEQLDAALEIHGLDGSRFRIWLPRKSHA